MVTKPLLVVLGGLFLTALLLTSPTHVSSSTPSTPPPVYRWMIGAAALVHLEPVVGSARLRATFDHPDTIVIVGRRPPPLLADWHCTWALTFTSYAALRMRLSGPPLDPRIRAILYDDEAWPLTPPTEQGDPGRYTALAAALAHRRHLLLIATPAANLAHVVLPRARKKYQAFLQLRIAQQVARSADIYEIQAQGSEANLALYRRFVFGAAAQAREGNPSVAVLAGLSTNPTGHRVSARELYRAILATRHVVGGYWLNIPAESVACPTCGVPQPRVAAQLLTLLSPRNYKDRDHERR